MHRRGHIGRIIGTSALALIVVAALAPGDAHAQIPDEFTNLKVLPEDTSKRELVDLMRGFAGGLGVRCNHCHVGPDNLEGMDFATDEKPAKKTARAMMKMVNAINNEHLAGIESERASRVEVRCRTCHRGLELPQPIEEVVAQRIEIDGLAAALTAYRELRDEHHGDGAYDFSPRPLNLLAERLGRMEKLDEAVALIETNIEFHPDDPFSRMLIGGVFAARGEDEKAIAALQKALELDPENSWAKRQLAALEGDGD